MQVLYKHADRLEFIPCSEWTLSASVRISIRLHSLYSPSRLNGHPALSSSFLKPQNCVFNQIWPDKWENACTQYGGISGQHCNAPLQLLHNLLNFDVNWLLMKYNCSNFLCPYKVREKSSLWFTLTIHRQLDSTNQIIANKVGHSNKLICELKRQI